MYSDDGKANLLKNIWTDIFRISPEENQDFDQENETMVANYLQRNQNRIKPYPFSDLTRLDPENPLTKPLQLFNIKMALKNMKDKCPGSSGIRKSILEKMPEIAIKKFINILNHALSMAYFPQTFKEALLCFIAKLGKDNRNPYNYCPISLLEVPGKLLERIINDRLVQFLENNSKFSESQYGFHKGRGMQLAIANMYETIAISQLERHRCNVVCRDVSKAFDKVWHAGLQYKILQTGFPELIEKLLCNFIIGRTARVRLNSIIGGKIELKSGVPQGSILSPTLYILFTADTPPPGQGTTNISFTDDNTKNNNLPWKRKSNAGQITKNDEK